MRERLKGDLRTIVVAGVTASVMGVAPAVAVAVVNADTVDNKDAVGAAASSTDRAGKLVATNAGGRLPNNILAKAPDANLLDGVNSTSFLRTSDRTVVVHTVNPNTVTLPTYNDGYMDVASVQLSAPRPGVAVITVQAGLTSSDASNAVYLHLRRNGTQVVNTSTLWDVAVADDLTPEQWTWVVPVTQGSHSFAFNATAGFPADGSAVELDEPSIMVTYLPGAAADPG